MGDSVEEIMAEPPDEIGFLQAIFLTVHQVFTSYGWYILIAGISMYYLWKNKVSPAISASQNSNAKSPEELKAWEIKEEQRLKAIQRLQQKYEQDAIIKAEKMKAIQEQKDKERKEELDKLQKSLGFGGHRLGKESSSSSSKSNTSKLNSASLRPEYNPLMGDAGSSNRVCFRQPGGGSGGG